VPALKLDPSKIPEHVAIIMDGNGRWATQKGLPRTAGHKEGVEALLRTVKACGDVGVRMLTVYAFSTENWERPRDEVDFLISFFASTIDRVTKDLVENEIRLRFFGRLDAFPEEVRGKMREAMDRTKDNAKFGLNVMVNYGGRAEIVDAVSKIVQQSEKGQIKSGEISEKVIENNLYTAGLPDPELLIRTAYERRISNFLLWQLAYTELYFTKTLWPDFDKTKLVDAIADFQKRNRKFGRI